MKWKWDVEIEVTKCVSFLCWIHWKFSLCVCDMCSIWILIIFIGKTNESVVEFCYNWWRYTAHIHTKNASYCIVLLLTAVIHVRSVVYFHFLSHLICFPSVLYHVSHTHTHTHTHSWPDENCILPYGFWYGFSLFTFI